MVMNYSEKKRELVINFDGEIDHHSCSEIAVQSDDAIKKYLPKKLIFDFENVRFMDSSGIGLLIGRYKSLIRIGADAEIINANKEVKRILDMAGIFKIMLIKEEIA